MKVSYKCPVCSIEISDVTHIELERQIKDHNFASDTHQFFLEQSGNETNLEKVLNDEPSQPLVNEQELYMAYKEEMDKIRVRSRSVLGLGKIYTQSGHTWFAPNRDGRRGLRQHKTYNKLRKRDGQKELPIGPHVDWLEVAQTEMEVRSRFFNV